MLLESENQRLLARVSELTQQLAKAQGKDEIRALQLELEKLGTQLDKRNQMLFGASSEKRGTSKKPERSRDLGPLPEHRHVGGRRREQPELPIEPVPHDLDEADRVCKACGGALEEWPEKFEESEEIDCVARRFVLKRHLRKVYRCQCGGCIETAPAPLKLHAGARYSLDFAIEVAIDKYRDHQPLERQVRAMKHDGLVVDSQTLFDQCARLAALIEPAYDGVGAQLRSLSVLGADETRWPVFGKKGAAKPSRWHAWILASDDAVYYQVHDSRDLDAGKALLGDFRGALVVDGYSVYRSLEKKLDGLRIANCWSHVRREYLDIEKSFPKETERIVHLIDLLFRIEQRAVPGRVGDERRRMLRQRRSRVVLAAIQKWVFSVSTTPGSRLAKAIEYMTGRWTALGLFVDDPRIPIHNNGSERGLRGLVLGRKNHYGSKSHRGAKVAARLYTLIETCKLLAVDPRVYLRTAAEAALRGQHVPLPHELALAH